MKERVRLMKCQNKKKNVKRAVAGIIFLSVIAIILSAYGVTQMYASPEKKALKTMLKSGELLQSTVEKYINNIDVSTNNYTGKINISELIYDNADYMQDMLMLIQEILLIITFRLMLRILSVRTEMVKIIKQEKPEL